MRLTLLPETYAVARAATATPVPDDLLSGAGFRTISRTQDELSIVAPLDDFAGYQSLFQKIEPDWSAFKVHGPFAFDEVGIVAALSRKLAEAKIGIFVISTYDTDYILVKQDHAAAAAMAWTSDGHEVD